MKIFGDDLGVLAKLMDVSVRRHEVTAGNLANVNTPGYRARELRFEDTFRDALDSGRLGDARKLEARVVESETAEVKADGNSVHMEREFALMQKNRLLFGVYSSILQGKLRRIRHAIEAAQ